MQVSGETPPSGHRFLPVAGPVWASNPGRIPSGLDLTGGSSDDLWDLPSDLSGLDDIATGLTDPDDQSVVTVLSLNEDVLSVARAWRFAADGPLDEGVRVVLVAVAESAPAYDVTGRVQRVLAEDGVVDPQVEVFWTGTDLPPYHREALAHSALLWRRSS